MDELYDSILQLKAEIKELESSEDFYWGDGSYQRKLERLREKEARYDEMYEEWSKNFYGEV